MKELRWPMVLALLLCAAPLLLTFMASAIAGANGCTLNEGDAHPCVLLGLD